MTLHSHRPIKITTVGENVKIVKMLLKIKEIKVNLQCDLAGTALHAACNAGSFRVVKALLKHKEIAVNQVFNDNNENGIQGSQNATIHLHGEATAIYSNDTDGILSWRGKVIIHLPSSHNTMLQ